MKKIYSTIMMLAMMVAALSFAACSSDDDNDGDEGSAQKTFIIDGESYYAGYVKGWYSAGTVVQRIGGMYLEISAIENLYSIPKYKMSFHISPTKVSELSVGQVFDFDEVSISFGGGTGLPSRAWRWYGTGGEMLIKDIKETELTIQLKNFAIKHEETGEEHTIEGTAILQNEWRDSNNNVMPFSETEP